MTTALLFFLLILGIAILLYPTVSDYYNSFHQSRAIASYVQQMEEMDESIYDAEWEEAARYNAQLMDLEMRFVMDDEQREWYERVLDITGTGIMGYIEIPKIDCSLPLYHGTSESVLQIAVGHIEGTSVPGGGPATHMVFSGHRGLPSAKLFTDLDKLEIGDMFVIRSLNQVFTYEIDQVLIVLPYELDALAIDPEQDYCTLVTCTPYGVNTHRLLVRGHRTENVEMERLVKVVNDAQQIDQVIVAGVVAAPMLTILLIWMLIVTHDKKPKKRRQNI